VQAQNEFTQLERGGPTLLYAFRGRKVSPRGKLPDGPRGASALSDRTQGDIVNAPHTINRPFDGDSAVKSHTQELTFNIPARMDFVNITREVEEAVRRSGVQEGLVLVNAMHITASVFINDDEAGLHNDYKQWLETLAPFDESPLRYVHNRTGEDNADAHMKRQVMGREVVVAITEGRLHFGPWEQIFYGEFDGRRPKRVLIKIIGE
jgi:secondary thiamine-phosphate synthase enzyme